MNKKVVSMILLVSTIFAFKMFSQDQSVLSGFWSFEWKTDVGIIKKVIEKRENPNVLQDDETAYIIKSIFGGKEATIVFFLDKGKLYQGVVVYDYKQNMAISTFNTVKEQIISKYGEPDENDEIYISPYYKGDGYEEQAIRVNKALIQAKWIFDDGNEIKIFVSNELNTMILYSDSKAVKIIEDEENNKDLNDF